MAHQGRPNRSPYHFRKNEKRSDLSSSWQIFHEIQEYSYHGLQWRARGPGSLRPCRLCAREYGEQHARHEFCLAVHAEQNACHLGCNPWHQRRRSNALPHSYAIYSANYSELLCLLCQPILSILASDNINVACCILRAFCFYYYLQGVIERS